jgi:hypothetical protein
MPHVLIANGPKLPAAAALLPRQTFRSGVRSGDHSDLAESREEFVLALKRVYVGTDLTHGVARAILVEPMLTQAVYFVLNEHEEGLIVKVDGAVSPLRTDGVKWGIARLAVALLEAAAPQFPDIHIRRTNLGAQIRAIFRERGEAVPTAFAHRLETHTAEPSSDSDA